MWARKGSLCLILKQPLAQPASKNKREVKTGSFSPPGVGGVLHDKSRRLSRPALPGRSAASLADCILQFVRRLTTKELVFLRFVAPRNAPVNGKKRRDRREKHNPSPLRSGSQTTALFVQCRFERLVQLARSLPFFVATSCPISAEISVLHPFIFSRPYGPSQHHTRSESPISSSDETGEAVLWTATFRKGVLLLWPSRCKRRECSDACCGSARGGSDQAASGAGETLLVPQEDLR